MLVLEALLFLGVLAGLHAWQTRDLLPAGAAAAPPLSLPDLAGQPRSLDEFSDRPTLLYFFAPWCGVCAASADNLQRLARWRRGTVDVVLVALDYEETGEVAAYVDRHGLTMPVLLGDADTARRWQVPGFPTYYVLDGSGHIRQRDFGYSTTPGLWLRTLPSRLD